MGYCRFGDDSDVDVLKSGYYNELTDTVDDTFIIYVAFNGPDGEPLEHPEAGQVFHSNTCEDTIEKLRELALSGLMVPEHTIERLQKEMEDE